METLFSVDLLPLVLESSIPEEIVGPVLQGRGYCVSGKKGNRQRGWQVARRGSGTGSPQLLSNLGEFQDVGINCPWRPEE